MTIITSRQILWLSFVTTAWSICGVWAEITQSQKADFVNWELCKPTKLLNGKQNVVWIKKKVEKNIVYYKCLMEQW